MIKDKHMAALQGMFPSWITTSSSHAEPNTSVISQVWHVDKDHVALSNQFFNKTKKNINENPFGFVTIVDPSSLKKYNLELEYKYSKSDGDLFDEMEMKLEAIASMSGMSDIFKLLAADVYKIISLEEA